MQNVLKTEPTMGGPKDFLCFSRALFPFCHQEPDLHLWQELHTIYLAGLSLCAAPIPLLQRVNSWEIPPDVQFPGWDWRFSRWGLKIFLGWDWGFQVGIEVSQAGIEGFPDGDWRFSRLGLIGGFQAGIEVSRLGLMCEWLRGCVGATCMAQGLEGSSMDCSHEGMCAGEPK